MPWNPGTTTPPWTKSPNPAPGKVALGETVLVVVGAVMEKEEEAVVAVVRAEVKEVVARAAVKVVVRAEVREAAKAAVKGAARAPVREVGREVTVKETEAEAEADILVAAVVVREEGKVVRAEEKEAETRAANVAIRVGRGSPNATCSGSGPGAPSPAWSDSWRAAS